MDDVKVKKSFLGKLTSGGSLAGRMARGSLWLGLGSGVEQFLRFVRNMIFAKILMPEALGIFVIVQSINILLGSFAEIGIKEMVIQNPDSEKKEFLNGIWFIAAFQGILLFAIGYFAAPLIAVFFAKPEIDSSILIPLSRIAFLDILFRGLMSPRAYVALKKMDFKRYIMVEQAGGVIGITVAIFLAFYLKNAWALVIGFAVEGVARGILSYIIFPFIPEWKFNKEYQNAIIKYALGMFGLPIFVFIFLRADVTFVGKLFSNAKTGLYGWAAGLAITPVLLMQKLLNPIFMPAFSEMQKDFTRINNALLKITKIFTFVGVPAIVFIFFYSESLLTLIYTADYIAVAIPFAILFTNAVFRNMNMPIVGVYLSLAKPGFVRIFTILRAVIVVGLLYPFIQWFGLIGAASAVLTGMTVSYVFQIILLNRFTKISVLKYWWNFIPPLIVSLPIFLIWSVVSQFKVDNIWILCGVGGVSLLISYGISFIIIKKEGLLKK